MLFYSRSQHHSTTHIQISNQNLNNQTLKATPKHQKSNTKQYIDMDTTYKCNTPPIQHGIITLTFYIQPMGICFVIIIERERKAAVKPVSAYCSKVSSAFSYLSIRSLTDMRVPGVCEPGVCVPEAPSLSSRSSRAEDVEAAPGGAPWFRPAMASMLSEEAGCEGGGSPELGDVPKGVCEAEAPP